MAIKKWLYIFALFSNLNFFSQNTEEINAIDEIFQEIEESPESLKISEGSSIINKKSDQSKTVEKKVQTSDKLKKITMIGAPLVSVIGSYGISSSSRNSNNSLLKNNREEIIYHQSIIENPKNSPSKSKITINDFDNKSFEHSQNKEKIEKIQNHLNVKKKNYQSILLKDEDGNEHPLDISIEIKDSAEQEVSVLITELKKNSNFEIWFNNIDNEYVINEILKNKINRDMLKSIIKGPLYNQFKNDMQLYEIIKTTYLENVNNNLDINSIISKYTTKRLFSMFDSNGKNISEDNKKRINKTNLSSINYSNNSYSGENSSNMDVKNLLNGLNSRTAIKEVENVEKPLINPNEKEKYNLSTVTESENDESHGTSQQKSSIKSENIHMSEKNLIPDNEALSYNKIKKSHSFSHSENRNKEIIINGEKINKENLDDQPLNQEKSSIYTILTSSDNNDIGIEDKKKQQEDINSINNNKNKNLKKEENIQGGIIVNNIIEVKLPSEDNPIIISSNDIDSKDSIMTINSDSYNDSSKNLPKTIKDQEVNHQEVIHGLIVPIIDIDQAKNVFLEEIMKSYQPIKNNIKVQNSTILDIPLEESIQMSIHADQVLYQTDKLIQKININEIILNGAPNNEYKKIIMEILSYYSYLIETYTNPNDISQSYIMEDKIDYHKIIKHHEMNPKKSKKKSDFPDDSILDYNNVLYSNFIRFLQEIANISSTTVRNESLKFNIILVRVFEVLNSYTNKNLKIFHETRKNNVNYDLYITKHRSKFKDLIYGILNFVNLIDSKEKDQKNRSVIFYNEDQNQYFSYFISLLLIYKNEQYNTKNQMMYLLENINRGHLKNIKLLKEIESLWVSIIKNDKNQWSYSTQSFLKNFQSNFFNLLELYAIRYNNQSIEKFSFNHFEILIRELNQGETEITLDNLPMNLDKLKQYLDELNNIIIKNNEQNYNNVISKGKNLVRESLPKKNLDSLSDFSHQKSREFINNSYIQIARNLELNSIHGQSQKRSVSSDNSSRLNLMLLKSKEKFQNFIHKKPNPQGFNPLLSDLQILDDNDNDNVFKNIKQKLKNPRLTNQSSKKDLSLAGNNRENNQRKLNNYSDSYFLDDKLYSKKSKEGLDISAIKKDESMRKEPIMTDPTGFIDSGNITFKVSDDEKKSNE
jgi:hypothetical protein